MRSGARATILCVVDDAALATSRRLVLEQAGYEVMAWSSARLLEAAAAPRAELAMICHSVMEPTRGLVLRRLEEAFGRGRLLLLYPFSKHSMPHPESLPWCSGQPEVLLRCVRALLEGAAADVGMRA